MRRSRGASLLLPVLLGSFAPAGCRPESSPSPGRAETVPSSVPQFEERLRQAMVGADTAALGALWAPEYLSTSAVGHTSSRAEALLAYGSGLVKIDAAVVHDLDVRTYGMTAVSLGLLDWAGTAAARPFAGTVRFQHVWVFSDGTWRLVASQLTGQPPRNPAE